MYRIAWISLIAAIAFGALCLPGVDFVPAEVASRCFGIFTTLYIASLVTFGMSARPVPRL